MTNEVNRFWISSEAAKDPTAVAAAKAAHPDKVIVAYDYPADFKCGYDGRFPAIVVL